MTLRLLWLRPMVAAVLGCAGGGALADIPIHDGGDGMTCHFYAEAARLEWARPGGDWADASDTPYGDRSFASQRVPVAGGRQRVAWDIGPLAEKWGQDGGVAGVVFLRVPTGAKSGTVSFASRENPDPDARPVLEIEWDDGLHGRLAPTADAHFACPTHRASGSGPIFQISSSHTALLAFPFEKRAAHRVRRASLILTTDKQYARSTEVGVYRPVLPWALPVTAEQGIAAAYVADQGIEKNPDVIFSERYGAKSWRLRPSPEAKGRAEVVSSDKAGRFEPLDGDALKVTIEKGQNQGLNLHLKFAEHPKGEPDEAYFRYYLRFADNWDPSKGGGKLPGFSGTYNRAGWGGRRSDGTNGWSARGSFFGQADAASPFARLRGIGNYVYYGGMPGKYGSIWGWNLGPTGLLEKNRWYSVEQHVKLNTPGRPNGVFRAWIDGKLAFNRTDVDFRSVADLKIESVWMNVYHGGTAKAPRDLSLYIDNLVVARKYIGPATLPR